MKTAVIIPSRFGSVRLPKKPLALIAGMPMIERVYRRVTQAQQENVFVATDHPEIERLVLGFGGKVLMTSPHCQSGTDRVAEATKLLGERFDLIINVQGDEPLIEPSVITKLIFAFEEDTQLLVATPISKIKDATELLDPGVVKVVADRSGNALYFSRQPIPYNRDYPIERWLEQYEYFKHIGVYAYRPQILQQFTSMPECGLEKAERLEQLRLMEAGIPIRCVKVDYDSIAVDTARDIQLVEARLNQLGLE